MRRSALQLGIPIVCALLGVVLVGASGKADGGAPVATPARAALPELAMAVTGMPTEMPTPATLAASTTRPAAAAPVELLISAAPAKAEGTLIPSLPRVVWMEVTAYLPLQKMLRPQGPRPDRQREAHQLQRRFLRRGGQERLRFPHQAENPRLRE
jgi:hypothetical protein